MNKTEILLDLQDDDYSQGTPVVFTQENTMVAMDNATWVGMGEPVEITVTIRPGDHLNVER